MSDYLNPNEGYYKVKRESKEPRNKKIIFAIAAVAIVGGIIWFFNKGEKPNKDDMHVSVNTTSSAITDNSKLENSQNNKNDNVSSTEAPITNLNVEAIPESSVSIDRIAIDQIQDSISQEDERKTYELTTTEAGTYRIYFTDVPQNVQFTLYLYNSNMELLEKNYDLRDGYGCTFDLKENTLYYVVVEQEDDTGSFVLNIGRQKPSIDISGYSKVSDSTQFTDQRNIYYYTTKEAGTYWFGFEEVPNDVQFTFYVYNSNMEQLQKEYDLRDGYGCTVELKSDSSYYIVVEQEDGKGSYTLQIGAQKAVVDVTGYQEVKDSTQFTNQRNNYTYTPSETDTYQFLISCPEDIQYTLYVYNSYMEQLKKEYDICNGRGIEIDMDANNLYYIVVEQEDKVGTYTLNIKRGAE